MGSTRRSGWNTGLTPAQPERRVGLEGVVTFFTKVMKRQRIDKCDKLTTEIVAVMAMMTTSPC
jgi:hypothetical protein